MTTRGVQVLRLALAAAVSWRPRHCERRRLPTNTATSSPSSRRCSTRWRPAMPTRDAAISLPEGRLYRLTPGSDRPAAQHAPSTSSTPASASAVARCSNGCGSRRCASTRASRRCGRPYDFWLDGKFSHCGIDSFELMKTAERLEAHGRQLHRRTRGLRPESARDASRARRRSDDVSRCVAWTLVGCAVVGAGAGRGGSPAGPGARRPLRHGAHAGRGAAVVGDTYTGPAVDEPRPGLHALRVAGERQQLRLHLRQPQGDRRRHDDGREGLRHRPAGRGERHEEARAAARSRRQRCHGRPRRRRRPARGAAP